MATVQENGIGKLGRILYVEPNNAYLFTGKDNNGNTSQQTVLTPPLEDLCISVNLTVEIQSRLKSKISTGTAIVDRDGIRDSFTIGWVSDQSNGEQHTFLNGTGEGSKRYLTTYYTDISYDNYGKNKIVEGLGIDNIQISFESWYTPTVAIKFVDVRGSAIFGNEEAIHNKAGELTADHIFGCFNTIPFPLFRLQVKGFLGHPVTYQLTVSDVRSEYNPNTGNFEMTVKFIGYSYGLLTDIPINYIVAAPYMSYYGAEYWKSKSGSAEWAMDNGAPVWTLHDFCNMINGYQNSHNNPSNDVSDEARQLSDYEAESDALTDLRRSYNEMVREFKKLFEVQCYEDGADGHVQYLCFTKSSTVNIEKFREKYRDFFNLHQEYNANYPTTAISDDELPDIGDGRGDMETKVGSDLFKPHWLFKIKTDSNGKRTSVDFFKLEGELNKENVKKFNLGTVHMTDGIVDSLLNKGLKGPDYDNVLQEYALPLDLGKYDAIVHDRLKQLTDLQNNLKEDIDSKQQDRFIETLGWNPDIGNIFKMIMCHLETFIHTLLHAASDIMTQQTSGLRDPDVLGVTIDNTDYLKDQTYIGPWPQVVGKSTSDNKSENSGEEEALAWVGDFSDKFIEQEVVESILSAVFKISDIKTNNVSKGPNPRTYPMTPMDMQMSTPFELTTSNNSVASLACQLVERTSVLFGIIGGGSDNQISEEMAKTLGRLDAYNYYLATGSATLLKEDIFQKIGQGNLSDILTGIALCNDTYDSYGITNPDNGKTRFSFETDTPIIYGKPNRHPMIVTDGNNYKYSHYYLLSDGEPVGALPACINTNFNQNRTLKFVYDTTNGGYHEVVYKPFSKIIEPLGVVHAGNSVDLFNAENTEFDTLKDVNSEERNRYINNAMFSIITNSGIVSQLEECRINAKNGAVQIGNYESTEDLDGFVNKFYQISDGVLVDYWGEINKQLVFADSMPSRTKEEFSKVISDVAFTSFTDFMSEMSSETKSVQYELDDDKNIKWEDSTLDDIRVISNEISIDSSNTSSSILGHPFYYLQNEIELPSGSQENIDKIRQKVKTLLFLTSFEWNVKEFLWTFAKSSPEKSVFEGVPYGYLLLLGGLMWRSWFSRYRNNGEDIIKTKHVENGITTLQYDELTEGGDVELYPIVRNNGQLSDSDKFYVSQIFGAGSKRSYDEWWPDYNIANQLISLFEDFVDKNYSTLHKYELTCNENGKVMNCDSKLFSKWAAVYNDACREAVGKKWDDVESRINAKMKHSFPQIWNQYALALPLEDAANNGIMLIYKVDDNIIQTLLKDVYTKKCIVCNVSTKRQYYNIGGDSTEIIIPKSLFNGYITSFADTLQQVVEDNLKDTVSNKKNKKTNANDESKKLMNISIYYYLKALWDNWLVSSPLNRYDVDTFFKNNFIFIDSFYRNVYSQLPMNCETVVNRLKNAGPTYSLFSYINDLISEQRCMFFALPDYVGFKGDASDESTMKDLFKPIPFNQMNKTLETSNKFVIIYVGKPSSHLSNPASEYKWDGLDLYGAGETPTIFTTDSIDHVGKSKDYHVPTFGVAVNRQNNTIFKSIALNNTNPVQTEAAINMYDRILQRASSGENRVVFHGQDLFNIYSNYSFQAEVEMMGNAQICPLMYFQLLNIPMWRGAYMIFNVQHTITPGNMVTRFKGMKMSNKPIPWAKSYMSWYTVPNREPGANGIGGFYGGAGLIDLQSDYESIKVLEPKGDHWSDANNRGNVLDKNSHGTEIRPEIVKLFNCLFEEIEALNEGWNIGVTHGVREGSVDGTSQHYRGEAMDLQIKKNGAWQKGQPMPELIKVIDILFCNHNNVCGQVLLEYEGGGDSFYRTDNSRYNFHVLHVALRNQKHDRMQVNIVGGAGNNWFNTGHADKFMQYVMPEFDWVAYRAYKKSISTLIEHFSDYGSSHGVIDEHFSKGGEGFDRWWAWSCSWEGKKEGEEWGYTQTARDAYKGNPNDDVRTRAYNQFWCANKCDKINDSNLAVICMWVLYWTGNATTIHWALRGEHNATDAQYSRCVGIGTADVPGGPLTNDDVNKINSFGDTIKLASRIRYHAGMIIEKAKLSDGTIYGNKYPGHRRRWRSITYNSAKMNNEVNDQSSLGTTLSDLSTKCGW